MLRKIRYIEKNTRFGRECLCQIMAQIERVSNFYYNYNEGQYKCEISQTVMVIIPYSSLSFLPMNL